MEIQGIYNRNDDIKCHGKNIFDVTSKYLDRFPLEYRACYDYNIRDIELYKVDVLLGTDSLATYVPDTNVIIFSKNYTLGHELFHVASEDRCHNRAALANKLGVEEGIVEGMTEYFHMKAYDLPTPATYSFHAFCIMMIEDIPNIFKSYFIPTDDTFFTKITDSKLMLSLCYALDVFDDHFVAAEENAITGKKDKDVSLLVQSGIEDAMKHLISIELSLCNDQVELDKYGDKFMDLLGTGTIAKDLKLVYPGYKKYAEKEVNIRIRKKV